MTGADDQRRPDELEPVIRSRVRALDEPVAWTDWQDVSKRARARSRRRLRPAALVLVVAATAAAAVFTAAVVLRPTTQSIGAAQPAAHPSFSEFRLGAPAQLAPAAIMSQTRVITTERLRDGTHTLYVSPTAQGGFCYRWTTAVGGCERSVLSPLATTWGKDDVVGVVSAAYVSSVKIVFSDGTSARPRIAWVATPINAGFFYYELPRGKIVAEVDGYDGGRTVGQVTWYSV